MPNCFSLTRKGETVKAKLQDVDDAMRSHFGAEPDPVNWYYNWYDTMGFSLACGKTLDDLVVQYRDWRDTSDLPSDREYRKDQLAIAEWLKENYTTDAWAEIGSR